MDENVGVGVGPPERAQHAGGDGATPGHRRRMSARRKQAAVLRLRMATWPWPTSCSRPRSSGWRPPALYVSGGRGDEPPGLALHRQGLRPGAGDPDPGRPRGDHLSSSPGAGCARETRAARRHVGPRRGRRDQAAPAGWPGHPERNFWAGGNKKPSVPCRRAAYMARPQRDDRPASVPCCACSRESPPASLSCRPLPEPATPESFVRGRIRLMDCREDADSAEWNP
jgi:hypothetical protein